MNLKRALLTGFILFIVLFAFEFIVHSVLLKDMYMQTASIWRAESEMQSMMWIMIAVQALFAFTLGIIYAYGYNAGKSGLGQGLRFGFLMAVLLAPYSSLSWYVILPIPGILAIYWLIAGCVKMIVLGITAGLTYKNN